MQLVQLRWDHVLTIGLVRIVGIVFLMIVFGFVELPRGSSVVTTGLPKTFESFSSFNESFCFPLLFFIGIENRRPVLRADVIALTIKGRRVVGREKTVRRSLKAISVGSKSILMTSA